MKEHLSLPIEAEIFPVVGNKKYQLVLADLID